MITVKYVQHDKDFPKESVFAARSVVRMWDQSGNQYNDSPGVPSKRPFQGILCILPDYEEYEIHPTINSENKVYVMNENGKTVATYYI